MRILDCTAALLLSGFLASAPIHAHAQQQSARALVQSIVNNELKQDANDHSHWMFRDANKVGGKSTVTLVVQTAEGNVKKAIEIDGRALDEQQLQAHRQSMQRFVTDPAVRQKQKQSQEHDDKQAAALTRMLPKAFHWKVVQQNGDVTTLAFRPDSNFSPPTRAARVFAAMQGTMMVNTKHKRIQSLKGTLIHDVTFGWFGVLGKLYKGGTFDVERRDVGQGVWQITATHVHIHGHALIFKTISEDQDEETSHYKPTPPGTTLQQAEKMLNDGEVARTLGLAQPQ